MFSNRIRFLRQSKQLNQVQFSEKLRVTKQTISNWENGNILPSIEMLEKISDFFEVSTDYLLGRDRQDQANIYTIDVTGLTPKEIEHIRYIIDDLRNSKN